MERLLDSIGKISLRRHKLGGGNNAAPPKVALMFRYVPMVIYR